MCLRLNTSAGAMPASITVQRAALFAGDAMSKAHVTGRANTWSGATGSITIQSGKGSVTIPQGVNVVLVEQYWNLNGSPTEISLVGVTSGKTYNLESTYIEFNEGQGEIYEVDNISNRKFWLYAE